MRVSVKVLDEQSVRQWGQITLLYTVGNRRPDRATGQVRKPDGSVTSTRDAGVQDLAVPPPGGLPIFLDVRQKAITVCALRPGDLVQIDAVWTTKKPIAPGQFWFEHTFNNTESVRDEQLEIDIPAQRAISLKMKSGAPAERSRRCGRRCRGPSVYRWKSSHALDSAADAEVLRPRRRGASSRRPPVVVSNLGRIRRMVRCACVGRAGCDGEGEGLGAYRRCDR